MSVGYPKFWCSSCAEFLWDFRWFDGNILFSQLTNRRTGYSNFDSNQQPFVCVWKGNQSLLCWLHLWSGEGKWICSGCSDRQPHHHQWPWKFSCLFVMGNLKWLFGCRFNWRYIIFELGTIQGYWDKYWPLQFLQQWIPIFINVSHWWTL